MSHTLNDITIAADGETLMLPNFEQTRDALIKHVESMHGQEIGGITTMLSRGEVLDLLTIVANLAFSAAAEALSAAREYTRESIYQSNRTQQDIDDE